MCKTLISLALVCGLALTGVVRAADPSLVGLWKLDDGSGTTAIDATGKSGPGTLNGDPTWSKDGKIEGCLVFDGTNDYVVANGSWQFPQYTIALWFRIDGGAGTQRDLVSWCTASATHGVLIEIGTNETMRYLHRAPLASTGGPSIYSTAGYNDRAWHHLAAVKTPTEMKLFLDGQQAASQANTTSFDGPLDRLFMGVLGAGGSQIRFLPGALDDVRIYNRDLSEGELPAVMKGAENTTLAAKPDPANQATDVPRDAVLSWKAGEFAKTHDVYFGTVLADVNNASRTATAGVLASKDQQATTFDPAGLLSYGQTYYWRVDEVNAAPDSTLYEGATWSFTAETYGYAVKPVKATASSSLTASTGPDKTIDGSGLDAQDQHAISSSTMWVSKKGTAPVWIQYEFDKVYKLYQMWVWNSNQAVESSVGFGARDVKIETSLDGTTWATLVETMEFSQAPGEPNYVHSTTVDFGSIQAKFVKLTINANWADSPKQASLSEVRFFYVPVKAFSPSPVTGAADVALDAVLNWRPSREAAKHEVYVSADAAAVAGGTAPVKTVTEHSLGLAGFNLEYAKTYTWKVNEVNEAATPKTWEGDLWTFSTPDHAVVENFESYNDTCNRIFFAWVDGFGHNGSTDCGVAPSSGNGSGSTVGNTNPPFAERTTVHAGSQAMPMLYDNTAGKTFSEATRTFESAQDWTLGGAKTLVLYFKGVSDNGAGQLYAKINGTRVDYTGVTGVTSTLWKQWNIDLASVATNFKAVKSLAIGVSGSGKGTLTIDDILLYRVAPVVPQPADPGTSGLSAYYRMEGDVKDSSGKGNNGTPTGNPIYVSSMAGLGQAIQFEGVDDYVDLPIGTLISTADSASFALWVNWTAQSGNWQRIFDFGGPTPASGTPNNYMFLTPAAGANFTSPLRFAIRMTTSSGESSVSSTGPLPRGWHHVAVVIDGTAKTLQIYLDGSLMGSGTTTVVPKDLGVTTQNWLGRSQYTADAFFGGMLDELRIYTRTLSAGEVRYLAGDR